MNNLKAVTVTYDEMNEVLDALIDGKVIKRDENGIWEFEVFVINPDLYTVVWKETPKAPRIRNQKTVKQLNEEIAEWMIAIDVNYTEKTYHLVTKRGEKVLATAKTLLGIQRKIKPTIAMIGKNLGELHRWDSLTMEQRTEKIKAGEMRPAALLPGS